MLLPGRSIVLREDPSQGPWDAVWSFHVVPVDAHRCRLVSRGRAARSGLPGRAAALVMEPVTLLMTRRMLLGIKERAECAATPGAVIMGAVTTGAVRPAAAGPTPPVAPSR